MYQNEVTNENFTKCGSAYTAKESAILQFTRECGYSI